MHVEKNLKAFLAFLLLVAGVASASEASAQNAIQWRPAVVCEGGQVVFDRSDRGIQLVIRGNRDLATRFMNTLDLEQRGFLMWHYPETNSSVLLSRDFDNGTLTPVIPFGQMGEFRRGNLTVIFFGESTEVSFNRLNDRPSGFSNRSWTFRGCQRI